MRERERKRERERERERASPQFTLATAAIKDSEFSRLSTFGIVSL